MVVDRGFELDLGLKAILFLIVAEHAIERAIHGVVIDVRRSSQRCACRRNSSTVMPESPVTVTLPTRARGPETTRNAMSASCCLGMRGDGLRDDRFVIAVLLERGAHLLDGADHLFLRQARSRIQLAGPLQLHIHGGASGAVYADGPDKRARSPGENQSHAVRPDACRAPQWCRRGRWHRARADCASDCPRSAALLRPGADGRQAARADRRERLRTRCCAPARPSHGERSQALAREYSRLRSEHCRRSVAGAGLRATGTNRCATALCHVGSQKEGGEQNCAARQAIGQTLRRRREFGRSGIERSLHWGAGRAPHLSTGFVRKTISLENVRGNRLPNQGQGVHHAMLQGIGCSRFLTMSVNPRCFPLY